MLRNPEDLCLCLEWRNQIITISIPFPLGSLALEKPRHPTFTQASTPPQTVSKTASFLSFLDQHNLQNTLDWDSGQLSTLCCLFCIGDRMANCSGVGFCFAHIQSGDPFMVPVLPEQKLLLPWLLLCLQYLAADSEWKTLGSFWMC